MCDVPRTRRTLYVEHCTYTCTHPDQASQVTKYMYIYTYIVVGCVCVPNYTIIILYRQRFIQCIFNSKITQYAVCVCIAYAIHCILVLYKVYGLRSLSHKLVVLCTISGMPRHGVYPPKPRPCPAHDRPVSSNGHAPLAIRSSPCAAYTERLEVRGCKTFPSFYK